MELALNVGKTCSLTLLSPLGPRKVQRLSRELMSVTSLSLPLSLEGSWETARGRRILPTLSSIFKTQGERPARGRRSL